MAADKMRIGDAERDEAVAMLQEHHAAGRLSTDEFEDRMGKALQARTASDLTALFYDLPGRKPGEASLGMRPAPMPEPVVQPWADAPMQTWGEPEAPAPPQPTPWYAQWWIILPAIFLSSAADGRLWFLIPLAIAWVWAIYPSISRRKAVAAPTQAPRRPLTYDEREQVMFDVRMGNKIAAIKRYRELTGADLVTAKLTVDAWAREIGR